MKRNLIIGVLLLLASIASYVYIYDKYNVKDIGEFDKNDFYVLKGTYNLLNNTIDEYALNWGKGERFTKKFTYIKLNLDSMKESLSTREYDLYYKLMARCVNATDELLNLTTLVGEDYDEYTKKYNSITKEALEAFRKLEEIL